MFSIYGVVDLRHARAVHARAGTRERYAPIDRIAGTSIEPGDARALVQHYVERFRVAGLYIADLDAILGEPSQDRVIREIAARGKPVWLDAGVASIEAARAALDRGATHIVVGLETLSSFDALAAICTEVGGQRVVFSLDLRGGRPVASAPRLAEEEPVDLIRRATDAGCAAVIVLDLARVGTAQGPDLDLIHQLRSSAPETPLVAGGGIRGRGDLLTLKAAGCTGALVATALLEGEISAGDIESLSAPR